MVFVVDEQTSHQHLIRFPNSDCEFRDARVRRESKSMPFSTRKLTFKLIDEKSDQFFQETTMANYQHISHALVATVTVVKAAASSGAHTRESRVSMFK